MITRKTPCYIMNVADYPWFVSFKMEYDDAFTAWARANPGVQWHKRRALWLVPIELKAEGVELATNLGWKIEDYSAPGEPFPCQPMRAPADKMHEWQRRHARMAALTDGTGRWIEASEMGLGKSPIALTAARMRRVQRLLVVDSAGHRRGWYNPRHPEESEFGKWWPDHPPVQLVEEGAKIPKLTAPILVTSYHMLHKLPLRQVDGIILDEAHILQNPDTEWSRAIVQWVRVNPQAWTLALTGTLCPDQPMTMHNVLDTLWPGRFGNKWDFGRTWSIPHENAYGGVSFAGVNEATAPGLAARVRSMSARTTKLEVGHLLPPFGNPRLQWVEPGQRAQAVRDWAAAALESSTHATILTHFRKTVDDIRDVLESIGIPHMCLSGADTPAVRHNKIRTAQRMPRCVIIATLHSVTTGVDLTFACRVLFAEIYPRVVDMIQVLGRFHRMTSTAPADITILSDTGGDGAALTLLNKVRAVGLILKAGQTESTLTDALATVGMGGLSREEALARLLDHATNVEFDEFT